MNYVGIDWAYGRAAWCAIGESGEISEEGLIPADEDGLARLVLEVGTDVKACVEMMSGAIWVRDQLELAGWEVEIAHARKVRDIAPLACKTDKVDAGVLADLRRRGLVPSVWVASLEDRAIRERLRRRAHLSKLRTSARNRIFGLLTQFGLRISWRRLRQPDGQELLERRGVPEVWRDSIAQHLDEIEELERRITPIDRELAPIARSDHRAQLLSTIPGIGPLISLTFASGDRRGLAFLIALETRRLCRPRSPDRPVGRALGHRPAIEGRLADASLGRGRGREPGLATDQPVPRALPPDRRPPRQEPGEVLGRAKAARHLLAHAQPRRGLSPQPPERRQSTHHYCDGKLLTLPGRLTAPHGIETPPQLPRTICATSAEREMSSTHLTGAKGRR
jgi:transposase